VAGGFGIDDQTRLAEWFRAADDRGAFVMLSNSDTKLVRELYDGYFVTEVTAPRAISCKGDGRQSVTELVVMNYDMPDVTSGHITRDMDVSLESGGDFD
jgi:DNA adenine methylase